MREGVILVEGSVGDDVGLAMRRGLIAITGAAGDGLGRAMIAGSIFTFGTVGHLAGAGMKRGTLALFGLPDPSNPDLLPTFAPSGRSRPPFVTLYLRRLRQWGFPVPEPAFSGMLERYNGDLVERGQGEVLIGS
jgi:formylmethanofuran dehydrogenase subunit C